MNKFRKALRKAMPLIIASLPYITFGALCYILGGNMFMFMLGCITGLALWQIFKK